MQAVAQKEHMRAVFHIEKPGVFVGGTIPRHIEGKATLVITFEDVWIYWVYLTERRCSESAVKVVD